MILFCGELICVCGVSVGGCWCCWETTGTLVCSGFNMFRFVQDRRWMLVSAMVVGRCWLLGVAWTRTFRLRLFTNHHQKDTRTPDTNQSHGLTWFLKAWSRRLVEPPCKIAPDAWFGHVSARAFYCIFSLVSHHAFNYCWKSLGFLSPECLSPISRKGLSTQISIGFLLYRISYEFLCLAYKNFALCTRSLFFFGSLNFALLAACTELRSSYSYTIIQLLTSIVVPYWYFIACFDSPDFAPRVSAYEKFLIFKTIDVCGMWCNTGTSCDPPIFCNHHRCSL